MKNFVYLYCLTSELLPEDSRKQLAIGNTFLTAIFLTANIMENEVWKDIPGFDGNYQISNLSRVKSIPRFAKVRGGGIRQISERIKKTFKQKKGYLIIGLSLNGKIITYNLHRLLAEVFIPNPNNYPVINHINGLKDDCRIDNLEWCTYSYNTREEIKRNNRNPAKNFKHFGKFGKHNKYSKPVNQFDLNGNFIKHYECLSQIEKELGFDRSYIAKVCTNKFCKAYNFKWRFANKDKK